MRAARGALECSRVSLVEEIERLAPADGAVPTAVPGMQLVRYEGPALVACNVLAPTLALVAQGDMSVDVGRETFSFAENTSLLTPLHVPATTRITRAARMKPFLGCVVSLDMAAAREMLAESVVTPAGDAGDGSPVARIPLSEDLLDALLRLVRLNHRPEDVPVMSKLLHREILYRLLTSSYAGVMRQIATKGTQRQRVARAADWLRVNFRRPLRVEDLAERAHMAVSTFHLHFREMTGSSPLQFQKQLRLFEARRMMLVDGMDAASAAFATGYESATQFNREYRRQFGQSPRRDVAALRGLEGR
ncbi:AraC family transcriptional regulator [Sorangium sp. So ce726]|uniref:AraC family transcriptional regulator n=1 Tax=Sorangium sp. So ce726 TaxID=3133319 RepID=UPI003F63500F